MSNLTILAALTELKFLSKPGGRIDRALNNVYSVSIEGNNVKADSRIDDIKSKYQSYIDLGEREARLRRLITESNSKTFVEIPTPKGGTETMSIAEVIAVKKYKVPHWKRLRNTLSNQLSEAMTEMEDRNNKARKRAELLIQNKDKDVKIDIESIKEAEDFVMKNHSVRLNDPLKVESKINELDEWIRIYEEEVDSILSASNAITKITV